MLYRDKKFHYDVTNYDALLIGWEAQSVQSGITINFGSSKYTGGGAAATGCKKTGTNG